MTLKEAKAALAAAQEALVHHDAHSDAVACALVYLAAQQVRLLRAGGDAAIRVANVFAAGTRAVRAA